jgi:hypothetical protein
MKRFLVIPLMFVYLVAVSGVMIHLHYCGQQVESWSMYAKNDGCNDDVCDESDDDGCCKDEVIAAKVDNDQNTVNAFKLKSFFTEWQCIALPTIIEKSKVNSLFVKTSTNQSNAPPGLWQQIPLFKLHSSFTYYG